MGSKKYVNLSRANLDKEYLHSNSTTHDFLFGALAEMIDNSRDADANNLHIYTEYSEEFRGNHILCFLDDGTGMTPYETANIIRFGKSFKRSSEKNYVGQYGNGLKSGSMRIGNDLLVFTKKNNVGSILLLSDTFLRQEGVEDIIVPIPSFDFRTKQQWTDPEIDDMYARERHELELDVIHRYSPYKTTEDLINVFDKIGPNGTLVMIYNLKLKDRVTELDFESDQSDIILRNVIVDYDRKSQQEHRSFRAYVSILYSNPRMKIYIQGKKVQTRLLERNLFMPRVFTYKSNKFKNRAIEEKESAQRELQKAENDLREAQSKLDDFERRNSSIKPPGYYVDLTRLRREVENSKSDVEQKKKLVEKRNREINEQKELQFIFGINIHNRDADGLFIYNCNRLIIMFEHTKVQKKNPEYRGLVGIVNVPYVVSRPTHNKQKFTDMNEQKELIRVLGDHMDCYYNELKDNELSKEFWKKYGYFSNNPEPPSFDVESLRRRIQQSKICLQCDRCLKWRILRFNPKLLDETYYKDEWTCADNTDTSAKNCDVPEIMDEFIKMDYRKVKETNFAEIEKTTTLIAPSRPMPSQKTVTLIEKDKEETISESVPPPVSKALSEQRFTRNGPRSSFTESDSDISLNGSKRPIENGKKRRNRDSDDENDPEFSLRTKSKNKPQSKQATASKRTNPGRSNQVIDDDLSSQNSQDNQTEEANGLAIKNEPDFAYENIVIQPTTSAQATGNSDPDRLNILTSISGKYRELMMTLVEFTGEMHEYARDLPVYEEKELESVSIGQFFNRFKECVVKQSSRKYKSKKHQVKKVVSQALERNDNTEDHKNKVLQSIDDIFQ